MTVFAEAAVRSKRSDYLSILDPSAEITADNLKRFSADPQLLKQAVRRLKQAGLSVISVGRTSVSLAGSKESFERIFGVTLVPDARADGAASTSYVVQGDPPKRLIDTGQGDFADVLAGVALPPQARPLDDKYKEPPAEPEAMVNLAQIRELLRREQGDAGDGNEDDADEGIDGSGVKVMVIDTGCWAYHPYFKAKGSTAQIDVVTPHQQYASIQLNSELVEAFEEKRRAERFRKLIVQVLKGTIGKDDPEYVALQEEFAGFKDSSEIDAAIGARIDRLVRQEQELDAEDFDGHGTSVVANLLAVAPKVQVRVVRALPCTGGVCEALETIDQWQPDVITCSLGLLIERWRVRRPELGPLQASILQAVQRGIVVLFAAGNAPDKDEDGDRENEEHEDADKIVYEAQVPGTISVGGAYFKQGLLSVSDIAHGFPEAFVPGDRIDKLRAVPTVCGLCGPGDSNFMWVPVVKRESENLWKLANGTSLAAPQVAGLCALLQQRAPGITRGQTETILRATATPVDEGKSAQKEAAKDATGAGLVNIKRALRRSQVLALRKFSLSDLQAEQ